MSGIVDGVVNYFTSGQNFSVLGQDKDILNIGNVLNSIFVNRNDIEIPKLVVIGSQSSGKSSILNSILGMDILPTDLIWLLEVHYNSSLYNQLRILRLYLANMLMVNGQKLRL